MGEVAEPPLVSIGIPTYNRAVDLERAVRSALEQDHARVEVIISDNASTDGTEEIGRALEAEDARVSYVRSGINRGATANINAVRDQAGGDFFMWLGDDDWLDPGYVSNCLDALARDPSASLAVGTVRYHGPDRVFDGRRVEPVEDDGEQRVRSFCRTARDNGSFYGLMPRRTVASTPPMENVMGNDLCLLAAIAFQGRFRIVDHVTVHRTTGGATASLKRAAQSAGMPWWQGEFPPLAIAWFVFRDIGWVSPVYRSLGRLRRIWLAITSAAILLRRFVPQAVPKYVAVLRSRVRKSGARIAD